MSVEYFTPAPESAGQPEEGTSAQTQQASAQGTNSAPEQTWGSPAGADGAQTRAEKIKTAVIALVATVAIVGGGVAFAKSANSGGTTDGRGGFGGQMPGNNQMAGGNQGTGANGQTSGLSALANALHGDFTVSDGNGAYTTQRYQKGRVTAVSSTSLTAKSDDGYTQTYALTDKTTVGTNAIGDVKVGHTVTIVATVAGQTATATAITDSALQTGTDQGQAGQGQGQGAPGAQQGQPGQAGPSARP